MEKQEKNTVTPYDLDGRPPLKLAIPLGLQHVLAMFVGNLTPLLIITAACGIEPGGELQVALLQNCQLHFFKRGYPYVQQIFSRPDSRS